MKPLEKLKNSLAKKEIPDTIQLGPGVGIINVKGFIKAHIKYLENNPGNWAYIAYWDRLVQLNQLLQKPIS